MESATGDLAFEAGHVRWRGRRLDLTRRQLELVHALAGRAGATVTYAQIVVRVYADGRYRDITDNVLLTLRNLVHRTRRAFLVLDPEFERIEAVRGVGFRWRA